MFRPPVSSHRIPYGDLHADTLTVSDIPPADLFARSAALHENASLYSAVPPANPLAYSADPHVSDYTASETLYTDASTRSVGSHASAFTASAVLPADAPARSVDLHENGLVCSDAPYAGADTFSARGADGSSAPTALRGAEFLHRKNAQISLEKLIGGGCFLQCFALFTPPDAKEPWKRAQRFIAAFCAAKGELERAGIRGILTIENGGILEENLSRLEFLISAGVKMFGFTWNEENCLGFPCGERGGLKPFGRRVAEELFSRGVFADVSHLSDEGVSELSEIAASFRVPVIASHSLSRAVWRHKRNLTDGQIRRIADTGGLVGVNFVREFLGKRSIFEHIAHIVDTGGEEVIALGTDFDGTENPLYAGAEEMPRFFEDMERAGLSPRLTEKLAYGNISRLF